jgi:hypothetical protein
LSLGIKDARAFSPREKDWNACHGFPRSDGAIHPAGNFFVGTFEKSGGPNRHREWRNILSGACQDKKKTYRLMKKFFLHFFLAKKFEKDYEFFFRIARGQIS